MPPPLDSCPPAQVGAKPTEEETDLWWGSYSGWALVPSIVLCVGLTVLIGLGSLAWVERGWVRLTFLGMGGTLWFVQGLRWAYRYFSFNYRLTTRRIFRDKGFWSPERVQVDLGHVTQVTITQNGIERLVGVGRVVLHLSGCQATELTLEGIAHPQQIAPFLRDHADKFRAQ